MSFRIFFILLYFVASLACFARPVTGGEAPDPSLAVTVDYAGVGDGASVAAALWITLPSGYHAYAHDAEDGLATRLVALDDRGGRFPVAYPQGVVRRDALDPSRLAAVYEGRFPIWVTLPENLAHSGSVRATLSLVLCSDRNCMPMRVETVLKAPAELPPLATVAWADAYLAAERHAEGRAATDRSGPAGESPMRPERLEEGESDQAGSDRLERSEWAERAELAGGAVGTAVAEQGADAPAGTFFPRFFQAGVEPAALGSAVPLGLAAGFLLNVMPCVLPVLTIKLSGLLAVSGHEDRVRRRARLREHSLYFAAGVMTWFAGLALCVGGLGMAWGGLFQNSGVVYGLMIMVFLLALSMFDVFTLPVLDFKVASSGNAKMRAYSAGLMATLLATPCGGPLLGGVLGWAVLQPFSVIMVVFLATGLGMALPHLLLAIWPDVVRFFPKPGAWMVIMERIVGFLLMGTTLYLLSVLPESLRLGALVVLLLAACAAWIWGLWGGLAAPPARRVLTGLVAVALIAGGVWWSLQPAPTSAWTAFSPERFRAALGKEALLVEFTADWCPSCKVLERTVLTPERLNALAARYDLRLVRVDLTRPNPDAEALLRAVGSVSIPVTAIFPKGFLANSPLVLRDIYTASQLEAALATLSPREAPRAGTR